MWNGTQKVQLQLVVFGLHVDLVVMDRELGVKPLAFWGPGERDGVRIQDTCGWIWLGREGELEEQPELLKEFRDLFTPGTQILAAAASRGAEISFSLIQSAEVGVVATPEEAAKYPQWDTRVMASDPFRPHLALQPGFMMIDVETVKLLAEIGAEVNTHTTVRLSE